MSLGRNVSKNIKELYKDNKKSGKARGAKGKVRSRAQIIAISMNAAGKPKKRKETNRAKTMLGSAKKRKVRRVKA